MKLHDVEQGSMEWLMLRAGIPTASELDALVTPKFKVKTGQGPATYLAAKVAEAWQGGPLPSFQGFDMEQGEILESEARAWLEFNGDVEIRKVGFITTDDGRVGCSPDGLLGEDCGLELKCPAAHTHTRYLLDGALPEEYAHQVHGSMFVTGFARWKFVSYRRGFPALVLTIERDEEKIAVIAEALTEFQARFDEAMERMIEINGGPPPRLTPLSPMPKKEKSEAKAAAPVNIDEVIP